MPKIAFLDSFNRRLAFYDAIEAFDALVVEF